MTCLLHKTFSNWVVEDVPCHCVVIVILPDDVIIETSLPKFLDTKTASPCRRDALEIVDQLNRIRVIRLSGQLNVQMVWHEAVGVKTERVCFALLPQEVEQKFHKTRIGKGRSVTSTANCNEVPLLPEIIGVRESVAFTEEIGSWHRRDCTTVAASLFSPDMNTENPTAGSEDLRV